MIYSIFYYGLGNLLIWLLVGAAIGDLRILAVGTTPLIILGTTLGGGCIAVGPRLGEACRGAFCRKPTVDQARLGSLLFRAGRYGALAGGYFALAVGVIMLLKNLGDPSQTGSSLALALEGLFWGVFIGFFVLLPQQTRLDHYLLQQGKDRPNFSETPLELLILGSGFIFSTLFLAIFYILF